MLKGQALPSHGGSKARTKEQIFGTFQQDPRRGARTRPGMAMASYKEMLALGRDPARVRAVARRLLASAEDWTEWERDFLEGLVAEYGIEALTTRQREKL